MVYDIFLSGNPWQRYQKLKYTMIKRTVMYGCEHGRRPYDPDFMTCGYDLVTFIFYISERVKINDRRATVDKY
jgi:hypothetical protein